jgi:hypothetical protein
MGDAGTARLQATARGVLDRVPAMGRVMLAMSSHGITFERIGQIGGIAEAQDGSLRLEAITGAPVAVISTAGITAIDVDRSGRMRDQIYPRLVFRDGADRPVFSVIGFEGLPPFDAALAGLIEAEVPALPDVASDQPQQPAPATERPGRQCLPDALALARDAAAPVVLSFALGGCIAETSRVIEELKPAMGFMNIIAADFHLHAKDHAIAWWECVTPPTGDTIALVACGPGGERTPLRVSGPHALFAPHLGASA